MKKRDEFTVFNKISQYFTPFLKKNANLMLKYQFSIFDNLLKEGYKFTGFNSNTELFILYLKRDINLIFLMQILNCLYLA